MVVPLAASRQSCKTNSCRRGGVSAHGTPIPRQESHGGLEGVCVPPIHSRAMHRPPSGHLCLASAPHLAGTLTLTLTLASAPHLAGVCDPNLEMHISKQTLSNLGMFYLALAISLSVT